ncbi:MAG: ankyrin repeat domain-containing protein, partial [Deltaproteobacteria bacterium]
MDQRMKIRLLVLLPLLVLYLIVGAMGAASGSEAANRSDSPRERPTRTATNDNLIHHAEEGSLNGVKQDLKLGADVNYLPPQKGKTALMYAVEGGFLKIADVLLNHGAKVDTKGIYGQTALFIACSNGRSRMAKLLLEHGANVDLPDGNGFTPLRIAAQSGYLGTVKLLRKCGADPNIRDDKGNLPADAAELYGYRAIAALLRGHGRDMRAPSERALDNVDPAQLTADDPFKNKAWVNACLIIMTNMGSLAWMKRLLMLEANLDYQSVDKDKLTALILAAQLGR